MEEHTEVRNIIEISRQDCFRLTVGISLKLYDAYKKYKHTQVELSNVFAEVLHVPESEINTPALFSKLFRTLKRLQGKRGEVRDSFALEMFDVPLVSTTTKKICPKRKFESTILTDAPMKEKTVARARVLELEEKFKKCQSQLRERRDKVLGLQEKVKQLTRKLARLKKKKQLVIGSVKQADVSISQLKRLENKVKQAKSDLVKIKHKNINLRKEKYKLSLTIRSLTQEKQSGSNLKEINESLKTEITTLKNEVKSLNQCNRNLRVDVEYLETLLDDNRPLNIFDCTKSAYNTEAVHCIMDLTTLGVSSSKVGAVMQRVAKLCNKSIERLPSRRTVDSLAQRRLAVAHQQIAESKEDKDTTLHTDETSKFGDQYMVYVSTNKAKRHLVLGLKPIPSKSAKDTLLYLNKTLDSIGETCGMPHLGKELICNIRNTMSDRASTEKLFNSIFAEYRSQLLPQLIKNFDMLSNEQQNALQSMNHFFCGLHLLISLAENSSKSLKNFEKVKLQNVDTGAEKSAKLKMFIKGSESAVVRFVRTTCKLFAKGTHSANSFGPFCAYLSQKGEVNILEEFLHNRFNIVFYNSEAVFYLKDYIVDFLENVHGTSTTLHEAVLLDAKDHWCLAGAKALGILSKLITAPLWRVLEDDSIHIADVSDIYQVVVEFLRDVFTHNNASSLRSGSSYPRIFEGRLNKDKVYDSLMQVSPYDDLVDEILIHLCRDWCALLERLLADHLPGGQFAVMTDEKRQCTESVVKHNKVAEEMFAQLDRLLRLKPNATITTHEAQIMYAKNATSEWLECKSKEDQSTIIKASYGQTKKLLQRAKIIKDEIRIKKQETLAEKQQKIRDNKQKNFREREELTSKILHYGLWQSSSEIDQKLASIATKAEKISAVKYQLQFRKVVLEQPEDDKNLFQFSAKGQGVFSLDRLTNNLKMLARHTENLPHIETGGYFLVGLNVRHKFACENNTFQWYKGKVVSQVPGFYEWFNIVYEEDEGNVYTYKLMDDYSQGDLIIDEHDDVRTI